MQTAAKAEKSASIQRSNQCGQHLRSGKASKGKGDRLSCLMTSSNSYSLQRATPMSQLMCGSIQPKLTIGPANDPFEQEADRVAQAVVSTPDSPSVFALNSSSHVQRCEAEEKEELQPKLRLKEQEEEEPLQRMCAECKDEMLQQKGGALAEGGVASSSLEQAVNSSKGGGSPLPTSTSAAMGEKIGADFSSVRVHTDQRAAQMNASINAKAFTHGTDIYFNQGKFDPGSGDGKFLLAHELTHVVQQGKAPQLSRMQRAPEEEKEEPLQAKQEFSSATVGAERVQRGWWDDIAGAAGAVWDATGGQLVDAAGKAIEMTADLYWSVLERLAPSLVPLVREISQKGILGFLKEKISGVASKLFDGLDDGSGALLPLFSVFKEMVAKAGEIVLALAKGDCKPLFAAMTQLKEMVAKMAGDAWNAVTEFFAPIGDFFSRVWNSFGAPVVEWLGQTAKDVWEGIKQLGRDLWGLTQPVRDSLGAAWGWIKGKLGLGGKEEGGDSEGGIVQWIKDKAEAAWGVVKEELKPITEPIMQVVEKVKAVLPLTAIFNLRETIQGWLKKAEAMGQAMGDDGGNVAEEQVSLRDEILPAILMRIEQLRLGLTNTGLWISDTIGSVVTTVNSLINKVASTPLVSAAAAALGWVKDALNRLSEWAQVKVVALFNLVGDGLVKLSTFIRPVLDVLTQIVDTLKNLMGKLPDLLMGPVWWMLPECIKNPIKDFFLNQILKRIPFFQQFLELGDIWAKVKATAMRILKQIFVNGDILGAIWTLFKAILGIFNIPPQLVTNIIVKAAQAIGDIIANPIGFIINILKAVKEGLSRFFSNILKHLFGGVVDWLFGQLSEAGIELPKDFSLKSILKLVFDILGLTMERIWQKLADKIGPEKVEKLKRMIEFAEGAWEWIKLAVKGGPAAIWEKLKEKLSDLWGAVISGVVGWINTVIIAQGTKWLLSLCDVSGITPTIMALIAIYKAIESFFAYLKQLLEIVNSVLNGIADLAKGAISGAAAYLEAALAKSVPIIIGFLANQFGLGKLGKRIAEVVGSVREKVDQALDWIIQKALDMGKAFLETLKSGASAVKEGVKGLVEWWKARKRLKTGDGKGHTIYFRGSGSAARIIIESTPQDYVAFVDDLKSEHNLKDSDVQPAKDKARQISEEQRSNKPEKEKSANINTYFNELVTLTAAIPVTSSGSNSDPIYGPKYQGNYGSLARVDKLAAGHKKGSEAAQIFTNNYRALNTRRQGGRSFYVRGHLLSWHLGGPGNEWKNLTPLFQNKNQEHEARFESKVKSAIDGGGRVEGFKVQATYGRAVSPHVVTLRDETTDSLPSNMPTNADPFKLADLLEAEAMVLNELACYAKIFNKDGSQKVVDPVINNEIGYGKLGEYQLDSTSREEFNLSEKVKAGDETTSCANLMELRGIGQERARLIYERLSSGMRITNYYAQIKISKKTLEKMNPTKKIVQR